MNPTNIWRAVPMASMQNAGDKLDWISIADAELLHRPTVQSVVSTESKREGCFDG
jgi:hypothetical protein